MVDPSEERVKSSMISRAQGCLLGQLAGDSLGSLVEFQSPDAIRRRYPGGVRELVDGGTWNTLAGQPTDDSEMALLLARLLVERGSYDSEAALDAYQYWIDSGPFDCGNTIAAGLQGHPNHESQANGAMMRISPLGIFGALRPPETVRQWAMQDAALTHPNTVCQHANALYVLAIALAVKAETEPRALYLEIIDRATELRVGATLMHAVQAAADAPPDDYVSQQGWVVIAFRNALWQLLHAPSLEEGVVDTVMRGGDTDTNAAICGALLGAVYGIDAVPDRWTDKVLNCRPIDGGAGVHRPRPESMWPVDAMGLAERLVK